MTTRDYTANVISASKVVPDGNFKDSKASGVWDINEALDLIKGGNWPNAANISPAAFVDGLFQTHLYEDGGSARTITNGIDLSNKGGLVWIKNRDAGNAHKLTDTERGVTKTIISSSTAVEATEAQTVTAFNSTGFTLGTDESVNRSGKKTVSWTFRKQPKFFDIVKYEGTGSARTVAHSLNTTVGMILIKNLDAGDNWAVYHRGADSSAPEDKYLILNSTNDAADSADWWNDTAPTTSVFTVGTDHAVNASGENYIAYLFAHNNNDGGFGEPGDQDIIKCGSYTGNNSTTGPVIDLGFEPQWLLIRHTDANGNSWHIFDSMRGVVTGGADAFLAPNAAGDEQTAADKVEFNASGFQLKRANDDVNGSSNNYIYVAIRRGGMQTPTAASDVFGIANFTSDNTNGRNVSTTPDFPDLILNINRESGNNSSVIIDRLRGSTKELSAKNTNADQTASTEGYVFDTNSGLIVNNSGYYDYPNFGTSHKQLIPYWKRARGYFDMVAYTGSLGATNFSGTTSINHNLGVTPEMIWVKSRSNTPKWCIGSTHFSSGGTLALNETAALEGVGNTDRFVYADWSSTVFKVGNNDEVNRTSYTYIAYLFATVAGVSKCGSFTQSGATNVDCSFTGDTPALIILKRTDSTGNWYLFDSARGIVAGNDTHSYINATDAEITNADLVDPYSGGFATTSSLTNGDYLFYAIAAIS